MPSAKGRERDKNKRTKDRVPNKTQDALYDILDHCWKARDTWQELRDIARRHMDPELMLHLGDNRDRWAEVERLASDALEGKYESRCE